MRRPTTALSPSLPDSEFDRLVAGPQPIGSGWLIFSLCALCAALFVWLAWAQVDEVVRASGRIEPSGRVKVINDAQGGRVAELHVREGDRVAAGAPLVTFDAEISHRERNELLGRWQTAAAEVARLEAEAAGDLLVRIDPALSKSRPDLVAAQDALLDARMAALASRRQALERAVETRRGELRSAEADASRLRKGANLLHEQLSAVEELASRGLYPRLKLVGVQREVSDTEGEMRKAEAAIAASRSVLAEQASNLDGLDREWRSGLLTDLARAKGERDQLIEALQAQETRLSHLVVRAPVAGIVDALAVTGPGQAIGPTDAMMKLVPADVGFVIEARVANEDIGRVTRGMSVTVKVRAFDYLRFGSLEGVVSKVAADATAEPRTGALGFAVTIETSREQLGTGPSLHDLAPGMVVDVEFDVGSRTILSYLTERLMITRDLAFKDG